MALKSIVEKLIAPKLEEFAKWCIGKYDEYMIPTAEHFQEYLNRTYEKYSIINTLVFHNSQRKLKDIYVIQTLQKEYRYGGKDVTAKIDGLPVDLIKKYQKILITDTAGMGKSTMMKRMFIDLIDRGMKGLGIPIYIELNRLRKGHSILMEIHEELCSLSKGFDKDLYLKLIQTGGFIFFLDGYDEISIADRSEMTEDIQDFISKAGSKNYYILTSRPESSLLSSFGHFQSFNIQPLSKKEAYELLEKYDLSDNKELSAKLIELLKSGQYVSIDEFLENPLLVSLLFTAYDYNQSLPFEKHRFYQVVFEAYFEKHDNTKPLESREKLSKLNIDGFDRVLRYIGYNCLIKTGVKFKKDIILNTIRKAKEFCGYTGDKDFSEDGFLKDLISSVPLFCKDGNDYKWVHKSLLEYFAARFIFCDAKANQDKILTAIINSENVEKYSNVMDLYYDLDPTGFSKNITLPFCEVFLNIYDENFVTSKIDKDLIADRISFLFYSDIGLIVSPDDELSIENARSLLGDYYVFLEKSYQIGNQMIHFGLRKRYHHHKRWFLARLLDKKSSFIIKWRCGFDDRVYNQLELQEPPEEIRQFEQYIVYDLDTLTGNQSNEFYKLINNMLLSNFYAHRFYEFCIDYEACKREAERIREEIVKSKNATDLLDGI